MRSPLFNMRMAIQMLEQLLIKSAQSSVPLDQPQIDFRSETYLQILRDECEYGMTLLNNLFDLQQLDKSTPKTEDLILLQDWIRQVSAPFIERAQQRQQTFKIQIDADLPPLLSNVASLRRILTELLHNACKYTPFGETIVVSAEMTLDRVYLRVSNSGVEISAEEAEHIFDKFYQISNSDRWTQSSMGLGLAIVKQLVMQLNGTIQVKSAAGWTRFTVKLPF
ncbi:MAG: HAMP domain-containing histidine kinase [Leptolyngbyaceae cyanobacterium SL_7_1]|nr:HAMP domain-containing histidine kinase [Leptolyngbyaceae cyanobacterium SL_7_1]